MQGRQHYRAPHFHQHKQQLPPRHNNGLRQHPQLRPPLPDWDEVAEAATNAQQFDYMELMVRV